MEEVKVEPVETALKCSSCYLEVWPSKDPHFACTKSYPPTAPTNKCTLVYCQACFVGVYKGLRGRDNKGFIRPQCSRCKQDVDYHVVATMLGADFEAYDEAMLRMTLVSTPGVVFCPGVNCRQVFFKPPSRKEKKRGALGNGACRTHSCDCGTSFCTECGEKWCAEHEGKKCNEFAKWKAANDAEVLSMKAWLAANPSNQIKLCPGCKRLTEKNGGCNNHNCVLCGFNFCWACLGPYGACKCGKVVEQRRLKAAKKVARRERKKKAAELLKVVANASIVNNNNEPVSAPVSEPVPVSSH